MSEAIAYRNGQFIPANELTVPVEDAGFVMGATVTEQLRTFGGQLFRPQEHFKRLARSLEIVGVALPISIDQLTHDAVHLAMHNHGLIAKEDDLGLCVFVTPGVYSAMAEGRSTGALVAMHTYRLPFHLWAACYDSGCHLATTSIVQVSERSWPAELKCRSRMHYYLADREARSIDPLARALLLDENGWIAETSTANIVAYRRNRGLISPPLERVLHGISLQATREVAAAIDLRFEVGDFTVDDLYGADEVILTSTPNCLLPVTVINHREIGGGRPGEVYRRLLGAWNERVEIDIAAQAEKFASRE
jgi:branched-subunit amino acid aminotransferase/4-amino-4-deoxychorismate lyase